MEIEMSKCIEKSEDDQTTRKRKRKKVDRFGLLPDDILLDILKRFPDVFLRYKAKHVCSRWFNVITNRILLDHASYILQNTGTFTTHLVDIREEGQVGLQVKEQDLDIPHKGMIRSWCNEFLLISGFYRSKDPLYVYNIITKEGSYLPQCNNAAYCGGYCENICGVALSFDRFKGIYKAVHLFIGNTIECYILILRKESITRGLSKWKKIEAPYYKSDQGPYIWGDAVPVQGTYLNWIIRSICTNDLVSMDMVKEEISIISLPGSIDHVRDKYVCCLFAMGGFLALCDGVSWDEVGIWVLKDFHRGTWEKYWSINDSSREYFAFNPGQHNRYRIFGIVSKRYLILKAWVAGMYSYDLKFGVMKKLDIHIQPNIERCVFYSSAPSFR